MNKCVFSVDFYSSGAERFPPVPPGLLISYPIYILHSLIKTFPPFLCFFPFFFLFLPTSLFILLPPFTLLPSTLQPWSIHLLHSPYLFCVSHPFSPSYRFPCCYFAPAHFPPVWDCCSEPPSPEHVIPWPELFRRTMTGREMKSAPGRTSLGFFVSFLFTVFSFPLTRPCCRPIFSLLSLPQLLVKPICQTFAWTRRLHHKLCFMQFGPFL